MRSSDERIKARLHTGAGGRYLWVVNPTRTELTATLTLAPRFPAAAKAEDVWERQSVTSKGRAVEVRVSQRNAAVVKLE